MVPLTRVPKGVANNVRRQMRFGVGREQMKRDTTDHDRMAYYERKKSFYLIHPFKTVQKKAAESEQIFEKYSTDFR